MGNRGPEAGVVGVLRNSRSWGAVTETKVEGVRSGRSWGWMWSVMEAPGGSKAFPGRPGFSAKKRPQGDGGGNPQAQIWGGASRGSQARGCWPVDLGGTDDASDRGGWHCRKMKSFGLGGGSGLKEPLALPPTVPCFFFFPSLSWSGELMDASGTSSWGHSPGPSSWFECPTLVSCRKCQSRSLSASWRESL